MPTTRTTGTPSANVSRSRAPALSRCPAVVRTVAQLVADSACTTANRPGAIEVQPAIRGTTTRP
ncbi:hypothetical protein AFB00_12365 [Pseudonocardia sp. HH130630-07]|nr:hypothetical protein AFB00_12365 [Pseudonocardia sp. HH130630-07]